MTMTAEIGPVWRAWQPCHQKPVRYEYVNLQKGLDSATVRNHKESKHCLSCFSLCRSRLATSRAQWNKNFMMWTLGCKWVQKPSAWWIAVACCSCFHWTWIQNSSRHAVSRSSGCCTNICKSFQQVSLSSLQPKHLSSWPASRNATSS